MHIDCDSSMGNARILDAPYREYSGGGEGTAEKPYSLKSGKTEDGRSILHPAQVAFFRLLFTGDPLYVRGPSGEVYSLKTERDITAMQEREEHFLALSQLEENAVDEACTPVHHAVQDVLDI